jgi:hypothetical protein
MIVDVARELVSGQTSASIAPDGTARVEED